MFHLFKKRPPECPVPLSTQQWMAEAFFFLYQAFGLDIIKNKKVMVPDYYNFPVVYDGFKLSAFETLRIVAAQMEVDPENIALKFYSEGISEIGAAGIGGRKLYISHEEDAILSSGKYHGKAEDGRFHISLEGNNLRDPEGMVATMAHEIAHIKLLGEEKLEENDERLTDLTTIIFGLGVFNANAAFRVYSGFDKWGYRALGYLNQLEWGYALALYAYMRGEHSPKWLSHLSGTVKGAFLRTELFMSSHNKQVI